MPRKKNVIVLHETILSKVDEIVAQGQAFLKIGLSYVRTNVSNSLHTLFPYSYQRQGIFASEFCTLFFSIGTDVLNSLIYLVRGKFQRQKIPVPRLGAIQPVSGKTLEPNQRQIQYQNSSAKSEANSVPKFRCQIRGKTRTKIPLPNQRQIQY